jgi:L-threonylcarbamoyladenylate synthase
MAQQSIAALVTLARSEKLISFPTDTVPALASLPGQAASIYQFKGRDERKPLILMGAEAKDLWPYIQTEMPEFEDWKAIASQYWPGALTLVLPSSDRVPVVMHPHTPNSIGVRVPNCAIAQTILQQTGPLATTSINRSGQPALVQLDSIEAEFPQVFVPLQLFWPSPSVITQPSTVIEWTDQGWIIHRQGAVDVTQIVEPA